MKLKIPRWLRAWLRDSQEEKVVPAAVICQELGATTPVHIDPMLIHWAKKKYGVK